MAITLFAINNSAAPTVDVEVIDTSGVNITFALSTALTVGPNRLVNPTFQVDTSAASVATGLLVKGAAAASGLAMQVQSSGTNEAGTLDSKGTGTFGINTLATNSGQVTLGNSTSKAGVLANGALLQAHGTAAINATATATAAQVATGYITSTSAAAVTITLPTGTLLGAQLGATQGMIHDLYIDNTAGANTVTVAVAVNGVLSAAAVANGASQGLLTVPSGTTGQACFRLMFSSATAYSFTRIA